MVGRRRLGLSATSVAVTKNDVEVFTSTLASFQFAFDTYGAGVFKITVTATDNDGELAGDKLTATQSRTVTVTDEDTAGPKITLTLGNAAAVAGATVSQIENDNQTVRWSISDVSGLSALSVEIKKQGVTNALFATTQLDRKEFGFDFTRRRRTLHRHDQRDRQRQRHHHRQGDRDGHADGKRGRKRQPERLRQRHPLGNSSAESARSVALDKDGNAYVVGQFVGTVDFDPLRISRLIGPLRRTTRTWPSTCRMAR